MHELLTEIERAIEARGMTARQASMNAIGNPDMIRGLRRGRSPTLERLRALCEVLGLELYVGRPRGPWLLDERRLELAVETAERGLAASGQTLSPADKARFLVPVYELIGDEHAPANAARVRRILRTVTTGSSGPEPDSPDAADEEAGERPI